MQAVLLTTFAATLVAAARSGGPAIVQFIVFAVGLVAGVLIAVMMRRADTRAMREMERRGRAE